MCDVYLLGIPTVLYVATRQQQSDLVREFVVLGLGNAEQDLSRPADLRRLIQQLGKAFVSGDSRADEQTDAAQRAKAPSLDLYYRVPATVVAAADALEEMMTRADDICARGLMLTLPRTSQMVALSYWWLQEFRRQIAGRPPLSWAQRPETAV
jgi:hypothetical protein